MTSRKDRYAYKVRHSSITVSFVGVSKPVFQFGNREKPEVLKKHLLKLKKRLLIFPGQRLSGFNVRIIEDLFRRELLCLLERQSKGEISDKQDKNPAWAEFLSKSRAPKYLSI